MSKQKSRGDSLFFSEQFLQHLSELKKLDFEFAYLAILTHQGLKPLSRWEKPVDDCWLKILGELGLLYKQIRRTVKTGKEVIETIFSRSPGYIELYCRHFENTAIDKSTQTQRFEGFLFGYPPCCVEQYILKPYNPNDLPQQDQGALFHWACKDCTITPILLPPYKNLQKLLNIH